MTEFFFIYFFGFVLCLLLIFVFYRLTIDLKIRKMAPNTKVCTFKWPGLYDLQPSQGHKGHRRPGEMEIEEINN